MIDTAPTKYIINKCIRLLKIAKFMTYFITKVLQTNL